MSSKLQRRQLSESHHLEVRARQQLDGNVLLDWISWRHDVSAFGVKRKKIVTDGNDSDLGNRREGLGKIKHLWAEAVAL